MTQALPETALPPPSAAAGGPFVHAAEGARTIFLVTLAAACGPLAAGIVLFGWRAGVVAALSIGSCAAFERLYYRVTKVPSLLGRTYERASIRDQSMLKLSRFLISSLRGFILISPLCLYPRPLTFS